MISAILAISALVVRPLSCRLFTILQQTFRLIYPHLCRILGSTFFLSLYLNHYLMDLFEIQEYNSMNSKESLLAMKFIIPSLVYNSIHPIANLSILFLYLFYIKISPFLILGLNYYILSLRDV